MTTKTKLTPAPVAFNRFYFSVPKNPVDMTREEAERECESAERCFAHCRESGCGISSKEAVVYRQACARLAALGFPRFTWED
jgi:hypothetical protein